MFCRLYRAACKKYRRSGLTFSASAHLRAEAGKPAWRDFIDAVARVFGDDQHCATSFQRESPHQSTPSSKGTRVKTELIQQAKAGAPAVAGWAWCSFTLNQMVAVVTIAYVVLQAAYLARKWWREEQEKP